jgi:glucoamylase
VSVVGDLVGGTTVLDVTDPSGDDNGPGTYAYPTSSSFTAGSFDITRFQVLTKDGTAYLRTTVRTLTPTFGNTIGAQMLDIFIHTADAAPTSTRTAMLREQLARSSPPRSRIRSLSPSRKARSVRRHRDGRSASS